MEFNHITKKLHCLSLKRKSPSSTNTPTPPQSNKKLKTSPNHDRIFINEKILACFKNPVHSLFLKEEQDVVNKMQLVKYTTNGRLDLVLSKKEEEKKDICKMIEWMKMDVDKEEEHNNDLEDEKRNGY